MLDPSEHYELSNGYGVGSLRSRNKFRVNTADLIDEDPKSRGFTGRGTVACFDNNIDNWKRMRCSAAESNDWE